jgi:regulation of enolase protein 1 (concanavalin A-like superfamily)
MEWLNEPPAWHQAGDVLTVTAGARTDFWRKTHDGGVRDSGHFYHRTVSGDFTAQVKVSGAYAALYDHAGLMVRLNEQTWLKCGIEFVDGVQQASAVVTHDWADWSVLPLPNPPAIWLRVSRQGATVEVRYSLDGANYTMIRQAYLTEAPALMVGPMMAAPSGDGFEATFEGFAITA